MTDLDALQRAAEAALAETPWREAPQYHRVSVDPVTVLALVRVAQAAQAWVASGDGVTAALTSSSAPVSQTIWAKWGNGAAALRRAVAALNGGE